MAGFLRIHVERVERKSKIAEADMLEIVIQNWDDLQRAVFDDVWDEKIMRYKVTRHHA